LQKILVIRFSSIGDIVLTSPVVRCLKAQTKAEVHFLCKTSFRTILEANPNIDKIYSIKKDVKEVIPQLKAEQYDVIIDLHKNIRSLQIRRALGVKSYSFDKINIEKWLIVNFKINRLPDHHIVDRYMKAVEKLGVKNDGQGLDYFIPSDQEVNLNELAKQLNFGESLQQYTAFAIGAAHATKRLPQEKIIDICKSVKSPIILLGGPQEQQAGVQISAVAGKHVLNTCGQMSLHQSASLVRQATEVISHDTGMMHIAAAFSKKIYSIWGNTIPEFGMYPYYPYGINNNISVEVKGLSCRPCSKIGAEQCPKGHFRCMKEISPYFLS